MITADDLKRASFNLVMHMNCGTHYVRTARCVEFPELTVTSSGPKGNSRKAREMKHSKVVSVGGVEVPLEHQAIADAINAHRAKASGP